MTADEVLKLAESMLLADVNALISYQHRCCRHCWGIGHAYQWKNERELALAVNSHARAIAAAKKAKVPADAWPAPPDESGGLGLTRGATRTRIALSALARVCSTR
jgi:hypothetical protein